MSEQPLNSAQVREVKQIAELETRQYFDHYLNEVWPTQQRALREHTHLMIEAHNADEVAHGSIRVKFNRLVMMLIAASAVGGTAGGALAKLIGLVGS